VHPCHSSVWVQYFERPRIDDHHLLRRHHGWGEGDAFTRKWPLWDDLFCHFELCQEMYKVKYLEMRISYYVSKCSAASPVGIILCENYAFCGSEMSWMLSVSLSWGKRKGSFRRELEVHCLKTTSEVGFINILQHYLIRTVNIHSKYTCNGTEHVNTWDLLSSLWWLKIKLYCGVKRSVTWFLVSRFHCVPSQKTLSSE